MYFFFLKSILYSRLVDLMKKNKNLGAACGRIHPTGGGFMTWYQKYEYAIGHWMQKATEHVLGCVLCSPGCFSLFRGSALMDFNVMRMYTKVSELPMHFIQYDQVNDAPFLDCVQGDPKGSELFLKSGCGSQMSQATPTKFLCCLAVK